MLLNVSSAVLINEGQSVRKRLRQTLSCVLASGSTPRSVYNSFDIVGDIAVIKMPEDSVVNASIVAEAILNKHKNVKVVLTQIDSVSGDYRTRRLIHVAGENRTHTVHKESGCLFAVDLQSCYFSPRLSHEHRRIAQLVQPSEIVINMFAGVGCFSLLISKQVASAKVYSIDINPFAVNYMKENIKINKVTGKVVPILGDSKAIVEAQLCGIANRVLMPLPEKALEYLPAAVCALKSSNGWIHFHGFERAKKTQDAIDVTKQKLVERLSSLNVNFEVAFAREVRRVGPSKYHIVADVLIKGV